MDISSQKQKVRQSIKERMDKMKQQDRQAESRSVVRRILENFPEGKHVVCAYYPMPTEVDIVPLMEELLKRGCDLYLPRTEGKSFQFRKVTSLDGLLPGPFGILEPKADDEDLDNADAQYVLVPGIAFDKTGARLGRGNGGYDRWLAHLRSDNDTVRIWGVLFDCQLVNEVPAEAHDEKVDAIVTPREIIKIDNG